MFEYKVKAKHELKYKEFKIYADTDIEEFFNRNNIDYVRNITDTIEHRQHQEIERLNKEIAQLKEDLEEYEQIGIIQFKRPYAKRYLEEKKKEKPNLLYPDSETIYKDYYDLRDRINKAIEYIKGHCLYEEEYDYDYEENSYLSGISDEVAKKELLSILEGSDKE